MEISTTGHSAISARIADRSAEVQANERREVKDSDIERRETERAAEARADAKRDIRRQEQHRIDIRV